ncbi:MAG: hypothetical protein [Bacteriophage sp.]|nr:MAG: hypothetical protein [Bacteriophage sp.]
MSMSNKIVDKVFDSGKVIVRAGSKVITLTHSKSGNILAADGGASIHRMSYHQALDYISDFEHCIKSY